MRKYTISCIPGEYLSAITAASVKFDGAYLVFFNSNGTVVAAVREELVKSFSSEPVIADV